MFNKKTDPLASSVKQVMQENALRRKLEQKLNEELGVASKKALPHELHDDYDAALKSSITEQSVAQTKEVGISREPPKEASASGKKPGLDTKGLTKMLDTPREDGGVKDIKEGILKNALAKMKGKKEKVVDAPDEIGAHIEAQSKLDLPGVDSKKMKKEETIADRVRLMMEAGTVPLARRVVNKVTDNIGGKFPAGKTPAALLPKPPLPTPQAGIPGFGQNRPTSPGAHPDRAQAPAPVSAPSTPPAGAPAAASGPVSPAPTPDSRVGKFSSQGALRPATPTTPTEPGPAGAAKAIQNALGGTQQQAQASNALKPGAPVPSSVAARPSPGVNADRRPTTLTSITQHAGATPPATPAATPAAVGSTPGEDAHKTAGPATIQKGTVAVPGPAATPVAQAGPGAARAQSTAAAAARAPMAPKTQDASGPGRSWQDKAIHKIDTGN